MSIRDPAWRHQAERRLRQAARYAAAAAKLLDAAAGLIRAAQAPDAPAARNRKAGSR